MLGSLKMLRKVFFSSVVVLLLVQTAFAGRRLPEVNPSCIDASRATWIRAVGDHKIEKALKKLDERRAETGVAPRNINWDGAAVLNLIPDLIQAEVPGDLFLNGAGFRQIKFSEPLTASNESFGSVFDGSSYDSDTKFDPFSGPINVAPLTTNKVTVSFTMEDKVTAGLVDGFGVMFTDVDRRNSAGLSFYDSSGQLIATQWARKGNGKQQLLAAVFDETVVASVVIHLGNNGALDLTEREGSKNNDFVAMDDWFFFLSDTEVPFVSYRQPIESRADDIFTFFDRRRTALDGAQIQNINWDGKAVTSQTNGARAMLDRTIFLDGAGFRQLTIALESEQPFAAEDEFNNAEPGLTAFTNDVNFAPYAKTLTIDFFLENKMDTGLIHGFGVIFTDVELPNKSGIRAYDEHGNLIANLRARPQENGESQFIGVMFPKAIIARIVLDMADDHLLPYPAEDLDNGIDLVAVDDWLFFKSTTPASSSKAA